MSDKIILLRETWTESAKRDLFSVVCAFALLLPGWFIESGWLSFFGGMMLIFVIFNRSLGLRQKYMMTPEQAIADLQSMLAARTDGGDDA